MLLPDKLLETYEVLQCFTTDFLLPCVPCRTFQYAFARCCLFELTYHKIGLYSSHSLLLLEKAGKFP
jgi:hypothetical protein